MAAYGASSPFAGASTIDRICPLCGRCAEPGQKPIGVQVIAAPWHESDALRAAWALQRDGITCAEAVEKTAHPVHS
jgi:hypothetical protein